MAATNIGCGRRSMLCFTLSVSQERLERSHGATSAHKSEDCSMAGDDDPDLLNRLKAVEFAVVGGNFRTLEMRATATPAAVPQWWIVRHPQDQLSKGIGQPQGHIGGTPQLVAGGKRYALIFSSNQSADHVTDYTSLNR